MHLSLPQIAQLEFDPSADRSVSTAAVNETFLWDFDEGDFVLKDGSLIKASDLEYLKVWIKKSLLTIKNTAIYEGTNYGSEHQSLIGRNFSPDFFRSELERFITEALMQNEVITAVRSFEYSTEGSRLTVSFVVESMYGSVSERVTV